MSFNSCGNQSLLVTFENVRTFSNKYPSPLFVIEETHFLVNRRNNNIDEQLVEEES